jgi:hypothetical protein
MTWNPATIFEPVTGDVVDHFGTELTAWNATIQGKRPEVMPKRLVTIADVGGPQSVGTRLADFLGNVWADDMVDAWNLTSEAMTAARSLPGVGQIKSVSELVGPREVEDAPAFTFGGNVLYHFYFTFTALVKGN